MANNLVRGNQLMLFLNNKSVAQATSHTLSINTEVSDINSKDFGVYGAKLPTKITWELSSENLYTEGGFTQLQNAQLNMQPLTAYFGAALEDADAGVPAVGYYTPASTGRLSYGEVYITSLSVTAASGDNATMSCTMQGTGKIAYTV